MLLAARCLACGPFFPSEILPGGDRAVLSAPVADFENEITRLLAAQHPPFTSVPPANGDPMAQSIEVEVLQIRNALAGEAAFTSSETQAILKTYVEVRTDLNADKIPHDTPPAVLLPAGLPREFATYLMGVTAYHQGHLNVARTYFKTLLARPIAQRRHRTVWAAFMIGKSYLRHRPSQAALWFQRTRVFARTYPDPLGLAASSYGWEAQAELQLEHFDSAIHLYLLQLASGDPTALWSLRTTAERAIGCNADVLKTFAGDEACRDVMTAYILADGGPFDHAPTTDHVTAWLTAVDGACIGTAHNADRLAWAMYQAGRFSAARRWLEHADAASPIALWVDAKLLLRSGDIEQAMTKLAVAARAFPKNEEWAAHSTGEQFSFDDVYKPAAQVAGELAALHLSRGQYSESLSLFIDSDWWNDAAYVAERVLTVDELEQFVDHASLVLAEKQYAPRPWRNDWRGLFFSAEAEHVADLRLLLARRLARLGRWKDSRPYFTAELRTSLDEYVMNLRDGYDRRRSNTERARSLFTAATLVRGKGMDLLGTELAPDWANFGGSFEGQDVSLRDASSDHPQVVKMSSDEIVRVSQSAEPINVRFHYRYIAADFAWSAAALLPDNSDQLSQMLCQAGGWLKARDPAAADRFYQALIHRCAGTALGKQAEAAHWFPSGAAGPP